MGSRILITTLSDKSAAAAIQDPDCFLDSVSENLTSDDMTTGWLHGKPNKSTTRFFGPRTRATKPGITVEIPNSWPAVDAVLRSKNADGLGNWPACFLCQGGASLANSTTRVLISADVTDVANWLMKLNRKGLARNINIVALENLTPKLLPLDDAQAKAHLLDLVDILRRFFAEAAEHKLAVALFTE